MEALGRMKARISEHPTGTVVLQGGGETVLIFEGNGGWRVKWPSGNVEDHLDLTRMVHKILKWTWTTQGGDGACEITPSKR